MFCPPSFNIKSAEKVSSAYISSTVVTALLEQGGSTRQRPFKRDNLRLPHFFSRRFAVKFVQSNLIVVLLDRSQRGPGVLGEIKGSGGLTLKMRMKDGKGIFSA